LEDDFVDPALVHRQSQPTGCVVEVSRHFGLGVAFSRVPFLEIVCELGWRVGERGLEIEIQVPPDLALREERRTPNHELSQNWRRLTLRRHLGAGNATGRDGRAQKREEPGTNQRPATNTTTHYAVGTDMSYGKFPLRESLRA
jgi:hypothetical protein